MSKGKKRGVSVKKLICLSDVKAAGEKGESRIYIDDQTIITPAAKDYAKAANILFVEGKVMDNTSIIPDLSGLTKEDLYNILKVLVEHGLLEVPRKKYDSECLPCGFKVVRGNSLCLDPLDSKTGDKVKYLEVIHDTESAMQSGRFTIDHSSFKTTAEQYETYCVMEGTMDILIDGKVFHAQKGDMVNVPKGASIECSSNGYADVFYSCANR